MAKRVPVPELNEPVLEQAWDGWGDEDLQAVIDAQNRVDDLDRERHKKILELEKMDEKEAKYQKKYREIWEEALAYGMTDEVFRDIRPHFPGRDIYLAHVLEDYSNPWHLLDHLPKTLEERQDNLQRLTERLSPNEREYIKYRMDENLGFIIELRTPDGAYLEIHSHGASVQSWIPANGSEMLWRPNEYNYTRKEAYPGGLQLKFPIHNEMSSFMDPGGFANNMEWKITGGTLWGSGSPSWTKDEDICPTVELTLESQEDTHLMWGDENKFEIIYTITLMKRRLRTEVRIINKGSSVMEFTGGLAAHIRIDANKMANARLVGLCRQPYWDYLRPTATKPESRWVDRNRTLSFSDELERVYSFPPSEIRLHKGQEGQGLSIKNARDFVELGWNEYGIYKKREDTEFVVLDSSTRISPEVIIPGQQFFGRTHFEVDVDWETPLRPCEYNRIRRGQRTGD